MRTAAQKQRAAQWTEGDRQGTIAAALHERRGTCEVYHAVSETDGSDTDDSPPRPNASPASVYATNGRCARLRPRDVPDPLRAGNVDIERASEEEWTDAVNRRCSANEDRAFLLWRRRMRRARDVLWKKVEQLEYARDRGTHLAHDRRKRRRKAELVFNAACEEASGELWVTRYMASLQLRNELQSIVHAFKTLRTSSTALREPDVEEAMPEVACTSDEDQRVFGALATTYDADEDSDSSADELLRGIAALRIQDESQSDELMASDSPTRPTTPVLQDLDAVPQPGNDPRPLTRQRWRPDLLHDPLRAQDVRPELASEYDWHAYVEARHDHAVECAVRECRAAYRAAQRKEDLEVERVNQAERDGKYSPWNVWIDAAEDRRQAERVCGWDCDAATGQLWARRRALEQQLADERAAIRAAFHPELAVPADLPAPEPTDPEGQAFVGLAVLEEGLRAGDSSARADKDAQEGAGPLAPRRVRAVPGSATRTYGRWAAVLSSGLGEEVQGYLDSNRKVLSAPTLEILGRTCVSSAEDGTATDRGLDNPSNDRATPPEQTRDVSERDSGPDEFPALTVIAKSGRALDFAPAAAPECAPIDAPARNDARYWTTPSVSQDPNEDRESDAPTIRGLRVSGEGAAVVVRVSGLLGERQDCDSRRLSLENAIVEAGEPRKDKREAGDSPKFLTLLAFAGSHPAASATSHTASPTPMGDLLPFDLVPLHRHGHVGFHIPIPAILADLLGLPPGKDFIQIRSTCYKFSQGQWYAYHARLFIAERADRGILGWFPMEKELTRKRAMDSPDDARAILKFESRDTVVFFIPFANPRNGTVVRTTLTTQLFTACLSQVAYRAASGYTPAVVATEKVMNNLLESEHLFRECDVLLAITLALTCVPDEDEKASLACHLETMQAEWAPRAPSPLPDLSPDSAWAGDFGREYKSFVRRGLGFGDYSATERSSSGSTASSMPSLVTLLDSSGDEDGSISSTPPSDLEEGEVDEDAGSKEVERRLEELVEGSTMTSAARAMKSLIAEVTERMRDAPCEGNVPRYAALKPREPQIIDVMGVSWIWNHGKPVRRTFIRSCPGLSESLSGYQRVAATFDCTPRPPTPPDPDACAPTPAINGASGASARSDGASDSARESIPNTAPTTAPSTSIPLSTEFLVARHPDTDRQHDETPACTNDSETCLCDAHIDNLDITKLPDEELEAAGKAVAARWKAEMDQVEEYDRMRAARASAKAEEGTLRSAVRAISPYVCRDEATLQRQEACPPQVLHINAQHLPDTLTIPPTPYLKPDTPVVPLWGTAGMCPDASTIPLPPPMIAYPAPDLLADTRQELQHEEGMFEMDMDLGSEVRRPLLLTWYDTDSADAQASSPAPPCPAASPPLIRRLPTPFSIRSPTLRNAMANDDHALENLYARVHEDVRKILADDFEEPRDDADVWNEAFKANEEADALAYPAAPAALNGEPSPEVLAETRRVIEEIRRELSSSPESSVSDSFMSIDPYTSELTYEAMEQDSSTRPPPVPTPASYCPPWTSPMSRSSRSPAPSLYDVPPGRQRGLGVHGFLDTRHPQPLRGRPLRVPGPAQAHTQLQRTGFLGHKDLVGATGIRNLMVPMVHEEVHDAVGNGLLGKIDTVRRKKGKLTLDELEMLYPYPEDFGSPFLYAEEQLSLRQCLHFWRSLNDAGQHNWRISRLEYLLWFRPAGGRNDDQEICRMRQGQRLGPLGYGREIVSFPPRGVQP
ncbi:hypothetical protein PsYK624_159870 [Phanerochaete sordida]|uniref:Uncharacterized protein n=1 Tax=Phanerochaete sordida TaxID=48140 RepID=A0A9P3LLN8_9APHY|nr:hypothetical protein PsYK624_159870 [Phanerochaete sordida]